MKMEERKTSFGSRRLNSLQNVFDHNAWDDVQWSEAMISSAENKISFNSRDKVPIVKQEEYEASASSFWDRFYEAHQNSFFKDRHWLFTEFPELSPKSSADVQDQTLTKNLPPTPDNEMCVNQDTLLQNSQSSLSSSNKLFFEVGCGAGNSVFPILQAHSSEESFVYCCDFSKEAISLVRSNPSFDSRRCHPFVLDITNDIWDVPFPENSIDCIILIFVLSAIHPRKLQCIINTLAKYLKPGGCVVFRDYGKYDMVQLRFKPGQCLSDSFYVRQDGTRVYFFTKDVVHDLFHSAGLTKEQLIVDHRLQVNRGKKLSMYRIWVQAVYRKPEE